MKKLVVILALFISGIFSSVLKQALSLLVLKCIIFMELTVAPPVIPFEKVAVEALKQYYGDQITLQSINREEEKNSALVKKIRNCRTNSFDS